VAPFTLFGLNTTVYPAVVALIVNLLVAVVATPLLAAAGVDRGADETAKPDYEAQVGEPIGALAEGPGTHLACDLTRRRCRVGRRPRSAA
jgi:hypothetical protein